MRYRKHEVGTAFEKKISDTVLYPSMTVCFFAKGRRMRNSSEPHLMPPLPDVSKLLVRLKFIQKSGDGYNLREP